MSQLTQEESLIHRINWAVQRQLTVVAIIVTLFLALFELLYRISYWFFCIPPVLVIYLLLFETIKRFVYYQQTIINNQGALQRINPNVWPWEDRLKGKQWTIVMDLFFEYDEDNSNYYLKNNILLKINLVLVFIIL